MRVPATAAIAPWKKYSIGVKKGAQRRQRGGQEDGFDIDELIAEYERAEREEARGKGLAEGRQKGLQEGRQEGLQQGLQQGEALLFRRQLERKFGPLSSRTGDRIQTATPAQIEAWMRRRSKKCSRKAIQTSTGT